LLIVAFHRVCRLSALALWLTTWHLVRLTLSQKKTGFSGAIAHEPGLPRDLSYVSRRSSR
jgi:hypothetical protein